MIGDNSDKIVVRPHQIDDGGMVHHIATIISWNLFVVDAVFTRDLSDLFRCAGEAADVTVEG